MIKIQPREIPMRERIPGSGLGFEAKRACDGAQRERGAVFTDLGLMTPSNTGRTYLTALTTHTAHGRDIQQRTTLSSTANHQAASPKGELAGSCTRPQNLGNQS